MEKPIKKLVEEAFNKAAEATNKIVLENPGIWYPCGFAWVRLKPARSKLAQYLKDAGLGQTDSYAGGIVVYNPSRNSTQWMDAKVAGAVAFANHLRAAGFNAIAESRID